jgi:hypothetical protein
MKPIPCEINGIKYSSLSEGCTVLGLNYNHARQLKNREGCQFVIKLVKSYSVKVQETGSVKSSENPETVKKISKDLP